MLPAKHRLPREVKKIFGHHYRSQYFSLIISPNHIGHLRARVVVSKKIAPTAIGRNRLRRQLYPCILSEFGPTPSADLVVFVSQAPPLQLNPCNALKPLLQKAHNLIQQS